MPLNIGDTFGGYRVVRLLGSGGMGEVYLVRHPRLPRQEALKVLRPDLSQDESFRERFIREADLASGLRHPHIVGIHDRGDCEGQLWISMDYIEGTDLSHLLARRYPEGMPVSHVLPVVTAVASALDFANKMGLLHRDVKPANIIVADIDTDDPRFYLADFGIARPLDDTSGITTTNMTVGTVAYAAPEQLMGELMDGRADQYALAATAYHLLTGAHLFPNSNPAVVISRHLNAPVPVLADTRPELAPLAPILAAALAKDPDDRYASSSDFARAFADSVGPAGVSTVLAPVAQRSHLSVKPGGSTPRREPSRTRRIWILGILVAAVLLLVGVGGAVWRPWQSPQSVGGNGLGSAPATSTPSAAVRTTEPTTWSPAERPPNPLGENDFVADVHKNIPTADIPGGRPTDTRLIAYGYQACDLMAKYPNPASAATPFYEEVARDAGYERDPERLTPANLSNEVWFMSIAEQHLCSGPAPSGHVATPVPTTTLSQGPSGPTIGDECAEWMKFSVDPISGQEMLCNGYPENLSRGGPMTWTSAEEGAVGPSGGWADAPRVGRTGSSCSGEVPLQRGALVMDTRSGARETVRSPTRVLCGLCTTHEPLPDPSALIGETMTAFVGIFRMLPKIGIRIWRGSVRRRQ